jgi:predicted glutamate--cysteine ligase
LEARLIQLLQTPSLDPLVASQFPADRRNADLVALSDANEQAAARHSLEATLHHWQDGRPIIAHDWIGELYQEVWPIAKANGISCFLSPLQKILREGNEAQRWQRQVEGGQSIRQVVTEAIQATQVYEEGLARDLCEPCAA